MTAAIETYDLHKHFRQGSSTVRALDGVSFAIETGEFVAIVGRSGSGKTTLLDVLGLLLKPTSGWLRLDGIDPSGLTDKQRAHLRSRRIGFVFQDFNLLPVLDALENVMLPLRYSDWARRRSGRARAQELLRAVGVSNRMHHRPDQLSGGEQQRVAIARALINNPALVLGDEPTGEMDTDTRSGILQLMRELNRRNGTTFLVVTHDPEVAVSTDRVIRLQDGKIALDTAVEPAAVGA